MYWYMSILCTVWTSLPSTKLIPTKLCKSYSSLDKDFRIVLLTVSISGPSGQYLVRRSSKVSGMVKVHKSRSDRARLAMKIFLDVSITWS